MVDWTEVKKRIKDLFVARSRQFVTERMGTAGAAASPHESYLTIKIRSLHIPKERIGLKRYVGGVTASIDLVHGRQGKITLHTTSLSKSMREAVGNGVPATQIDSVLLDQVCYAGGKIKLEACLWAFETSDLLENYLDLLDVVCATAGASYLAEMRHLASPIEKGIDLLIGGNDSGRELLIALDWGQDTPMSQTVICIGMDRPDLNVDLKACKLHPTDCRLLLPNDTEYVGAPYMVCEVTVSSSRADYMAIPELVGPFAKFYDSLRDRKEIPASEQLLALRAALAGCPDLTLDDIELATKRAESRWKLLFGAGKTAGGSSNLESKEDFVKGLFLRE